MQRREPTNKPTHASRGAAFLAGFESAVAAAFPTADAYRHDVAKFAWDAFRIKLWHKQVEIATALTKHNRVAVKSGHKIGKSILLAVLAWWWVTVMPRGTVIMTSASGRQVKITLWKEIRKLYALHLKHKTPFHFPAPAKLPATGVEYDDGRAILGFSTDDAERMAGISGDQLLFLLDEASGIKEEIHTAVEGNCAAGPGCAVLMTSNPTQVSGTFFDAFNRAKSDWCTFTVSSEETPNAVSGQDLFPGLASKSWVEKRKRAWGADSPRYAVRVKGNFPLQGDDTVFPLGVIDTAQARWFQDAAPDSDDIAVPVDEPGGPIDAGLDVARFGDDESVAKFRRGWWMGKAHVVSGLDTQALASWFIGHCKRLYPKQRVRVKVDGTGVGAGVVDALRRAVNEGEKWLTVVDVVSSAAASDDEYLNCRAQMAFHARKWLETVGAIPEDLELEGELVAIKYKFTPKGQIQIESKDDLRKRLGRSPDRADALVLAAWDVPGSDVPTETWSSPIVDSRWGNEGRGF